MQKQNFTITQAGLIALATTIIGQAAALVPSWAPHVQTAIQLTTAIITVGFLVANSIHAAGAAGTQATPSPSDPADVAKIVQQQLATLDLATPIRAEVGRILQTASAPALVPVPPPVA